MREGNVDERGNHRLREEFAVGCFHQEVVVSAERSHEQPVIRSVEGLCGVLQPRVGVGEEGAQLGALVFQLF